MKNYNPMSMFDNGIAKFTTIESKQAEYARAVENEKRIKAEIDKMWKDRHG
jgi:hypothetical protein